LNRNQDILNLADRCVKCGLCLPQCPTYALSRNESESPRGRIALIQALASHMLEANDAHLYQHLDNCLLCRRCERICPSGVEYSQIMDMARQQIHQVRPPSRVHKLGQRLLSQHMQEAIQGLRIYQKSGAQKLLRPLLRRNKNLDWLQSLLPPLPARTSFKPHYPATDKIANRPAGQVAIFTGCMGKNIDASTLQAAIELLNALGYDVALPDKQGCCGALQQHSGQLSEARQLASRNLQAFDKADYDAVLFLASGCGAQLMDSAQAGPLQAKWQDINAFLIGVLQKTPLHFAPLNKRIVVHQPCSQRNALRLPDVAANLLAHIPGIHLTRLPENTSCCGAAGDYMLRHPQTAAILRQRLLDTILSDEVDIIVSTNIGCSLFIQAGLERQSLRVVHPVQLMAEQFCLRNEK